MKSMYCPKCDVRVDAEVVESFEDVLVRKIPLRAIQQLAVCPHCNTQIADEEMSRFNLNAALEEYRAHENLLGPAQIRKAYTRYGLSQSSFAKLLGLGGATLSRYEHGAIQNRQIDNSIRRASEPQGMLSILADRGALIPQDQLANARRIANSLAHDERSHFSRFFQDMGNFRVEVCTDERSEYTGFRKLDPDKVTQMIIFLVKNCENMGRTRLNKALFYSDFACFAATATSMSGLKYARAPHGPVVDGYDSLFGMAVRNGAIIEESVTFGVYDTVVYRTSTEFDRSAFSNMEMEILENVCRFVNGFERVSDLSDYSHKERMWLESDNGTTLSYMGAYELNQPELFFED